MKWLGEKKFNSIDDAMEYARTTPNDQIMQDCGAPLQPAHIYVTTDGVEIITPIRDAEPANAIEFVGSFHPGVSGNKK